MILLVLAAALLSACGSSGKSTASTGTTAAASPSEIGATEEAIRKCIPSGGLTSIRSIEARRKFIACFAPANKTSQPRTCAAATFSSAGQGVTEGQIVHALATCIGKES